MPADLNELRTRVFKPDNRVPGLSRRERAGWTNASNCRFSGGDQTAVTLRKSTAVLAAVASVWAFVSIVAMTYGSLLNWPDYVHVNFGVPFTFATHTLSTLVGPADAWDVDIVALVTDLVFWLAGMLVILLVGLRNKLKAGVSNPAAVV